MHDWHTSGTSETPVLYPIPCSSRHVITPSDAARPYAEPPDSTMALIGLSAVIGIVRGVSLDAGPPPLMSQPAVAPSGNLKSLISLTEISVNKTNPPLINVRFIQSK